MADAVIEANQGETGLVDAYEEVAEETVEDVVEEVAEEVEVAEEE